MDFEAISTIFTIAIFVGLFIFIAKIIPKKNHDYDSDDSSRSRYDNIDEELIRQDLEYQADALRRNNAPSWKVKEIDNELGRSTVERNYEDYRTGYDGDESN
ncbi:hypothetical protein ACFQ4X_07100 [Fictibacillus halophilus]|uniref:hypothetical protein n=1 Tax=Fictibacillus halophilus TaxID=1610490 RepID=UPI00363DFFE8